MTSMLVGCAMMSISCTIFIPDQIFSFLLSSPTTSRTSPVPLMSAVLMHADVACRRGGAPGVVSPPRRMRARGFA